MLLNSSQTNFLTLFTSCRPGLSLQRFSDGRRPAVYNFSSLRAGWNEREPGAGGERGFELYLKGNEKKSNHDLALPLSCNLTRCCHGGDIHFHRRRNNELSTLSYLVFLCGPHISFEPECVQKKKAVNYLQALELPLSQCLHENSRTHIPLGPCALVREFIKMYEKTFN